MTSVEENQVIKQCTEKNKIGFYKVCTLYYGNFDLNISQGLYYICIVYCTMYNRYLTEMPKQLLQEINPQILKHKRL